MAIMIMLKNKKRNESIAQLSATFSTTKSSTRSRKRGTSGGRIGKAIDLLNMNFSVGVNMYSEKVTCRCQDLYSVTVGEVSPHIGISSSEANEMWMRTWTL